MIFIESDDGYGPFGAKSIGEVGQVPAVAAVGNAIFNAIGRRMKDLPITRDKFWEHSHENLCQRQSPRPRAGRVARRSRPRRDGKAVSFAGGGSDLLGMVKERIVNAGRPGQPEGDQGTGSGGTPTAERRDTSAA